MNKRPFVGTVVCFGIGNVWMISGKWYFPVCMVVLLVGWLIREWKKEHKIKSFVLFWTCMEAVAFLVGSAHTDKQQEFRETYLPYIEDGKEAFLQGIVCGKEAKNEEYHVYLKDVILQIENQRYRTNQVLVHLSTDEYSIGTTLLVNGTIQRFEQAANEGGYDEEQYYHGRKTDYGLWADEVIGCYGKTSYVKESLYQLREKLKQSIKLNMSEETSGTLVVMTLGDKSLLDTEVKELYQSLGISHVLVISGLHIAMLGTILFKILRKTGRSIAFSTGVAVLCLVAYGIMTGNSASVVRALIMFAMRMTGKCLGRTYDRATGLAVAVLILLWQNPFLITDAGFLFSVAAVSGVIAAGEQAKTWKVNGMIQLFTLPLVAYYYYEIPVYALIVNLIVIPLVTPLVALGFVGSVIGLIWQNVAEIILFVPHIMLLVMEKIGEIFRLIPCSGLIVGCPDVGQIYVYFLILGIFCKRLRYVDTEKNKKTESKKQSLKWCAGNLGYLFVMWILLISRPEHMTKIDILDVGQGDGICIQTADGMNLFIDGGSSSEKNVGKYRIEPYLKYHGVAKIDYWFVSHCDTDHISGLQELLEMGYKVDNLILSKYAVKNENSKELISLAKMTETSVCYMETGDVLHMKEASIRCIFPGKDMQTEDANAASLVLLYEEGNFQGMFTGDIGCEQELSMLENLDNGEPGQIDFYKAAHHGSNYSNDKEWLNYLKPKVAVISCGINNLYGHPGEKALENMEAAGSAIYDTRREGEVMLVVGEEEMEVRNYRNQLEAEWYPVVE